MRCQFPAAAALLILFTSSLQARAMADGTLPSRAFTLPAALVAGSEPSSFDLIDYRADQAQSRKPPVGEIEPHTIFGIKRHIGIAAGYDNGVLHGSVGLYVTVAEFGKWNFGVPSPALGFGRYRIYDAKSRSGIAKEESSIFVSLASVHYRAGRIESLGVNWYVNLEQVFDFRRNMAGSQVGISFSHK